MQTANAPTKGRFVPLPSRLVPLPPLFGKRNGRPRVFPTAAFPPFFVGGLATFTIISCEYIHIYIHFLTHARTHARRFERERVSEEGLTFLRLHRVNRGGVERRKKAASIFPPPPPFLHRIYPRGLPPFQTDLFPSRLRERAEMQRILFLTIQTGSRPRRPT